MGAPCRGPSLTLRAFVVRNGPPDHFVRLWRTIPHDAELVHRLSIAQRKTAAPESAAADLSEGRNLVAGHFKVVKDRRARIEGHAGGPGRSRIIARTVPAAL